MKNIFFSFCFPPKTILSICLLVGFITLNAQEVIIPIETETNTILLQTDTKNRLRMVYFGKSLNINSEYSSISGMYQFNDGNAGIYNSVYTPAGTWNLSEPAIQLIHADGNPSLELTYVKHDTGLLDNNTSITSIILKDPLNAYVSDC